ncbi:hypothetical protein [Parabacteroides hominis]|jgi:hypothetical protein|uniref:Uncharacterized protein n=1 Tax=Parabacteroides hominis TaxID=2763057 RepID=A0ABR7DUJ5_9BACT|nr:hypothetical protein [Parabacteroides hominis]MBC5635096.1 hypothetical protein [Parabacteroides hominis]
MMYPFNNNPFVPFGPFGPFPRTARRTIVPRLDTRGIPELYTTGLVENTESEENTVDYGINPCIWKALPNQTLVLWKVRHPVSQNGASSPVTVVIPTGNSSSTVTSPNSAAGTTKVKVVDNKSTQVAGRDVTVPTGSGAEEQQGYTTEHIVYIDKCAGIFRLLGVTAQNSPARTTVGSNTPAESAAKSK